jgi:predicted ATPase
LEPDKEQPALKKITYRPFSKNERSEAIDVIHAGSMVKELAGLYLAIREKIVAGTQLIVEEPEAHLHPSAQKKLARILMKLATMGVVITITTHSDIILREVAHLVGRYHEQPKDVLPAEKVKVILLKESEGGSISEELKIPPSGILEGLPTFDEVIVELYEEEIKLESSTSKR